MSDSDRTNSRPAPDLLLDELESIKDVLDDEPAAPADIPLLDDIVIDHLDDNARLLDLDQIFDDGSEARDEIVETAAPDVQFPRFSLDTALPETDVVAPEPVAAPRPAAGVRRVRPDYGREVLIQELVDEFIPQIEAALRDRLRALDDAALKNWKAQREPDC